MLLAALTALFMGIGYTVGGGGGAMIALLVAAGMNLFTFWNADRLVLSMHGAREVDMASAPEFVGLVRELATRAGLPWPRTYVIDSEHPNAFATGRDPGHAAVAATTGLIRMLDRDELAGVMAHELAHIRNRDTLIMTMTATIAGAIAMIANFGLLFGGGHDRREGGGNMLAMLLAVIVAPFAAMIVQLAISRNREYDADRGGAEISGNPRALASALARIAGAAASIPNRVSAANPAAAQLYIVPTAQGRDSLFATHPDTANRIAALEAMAAGTGTGTGAPPRRRPRAASVPAARRRASALDPLGHGR